MKPSHLIAFAALLLPMGMSHAQYGGSAAVQATPATDADLAKGNAVKDPSGQPVGTIDSLNDEGVVLVVGERKIQVPRKVIGKNERGLVIALTRTELEHAAPEPPATI